MGGDLTHKNGTGSETIYPGKNTIEAETNSLKFKEPFLLVAPANEDGHTGSQFMITLGELPALNGTKNTIFGRVLQGKKTIHQIADINDMR